MTDLYDVYSVVRVYFLIELNVIDGTHFSQVQLKATSLAFTHILFMCGYMYGYIHKFSHILSLKFFDILVFQKDFL